MYELYVSNQRDNEHLQQSMPYRGSMTPATYYHSPYLGAVVSRKNDSDAKPVIVKLAEVLVVLSLHHCKISSFCI